MPGPKETNRHADFVVKEMSEAEWHIRNATVDVSQLVQPLVDGTAIGDAAVFSLDGEAVMLSDLWSDKPVLIVTGSMTCPPSRRLNPVTTALAEQFADRLHVIILYVIDAHPSGDLCPYTGTDWPSQTNLDEEILIRQPRDQAERCKRAQEYAELLRLGTTVVVDNMDNAAWAALGKSPNTAVLVDTSGVCLASQNWFRPDQLKGILQVKLDT